MDCFTYFTVTTLTQYETSYFGTSKWLNSALKRHGQLKHLCNVKVNLMYLCSERR